MTKDKRKDVAHAWIAVQRNWWAWEAIERTSEFRPKTAWGLLQSLIDLADTQELIQDIGAGPLEDFIRAHAPTFIQPIERLASQNRRFRKALRAARIPKGNDDISQRLIQLGCLTVPTRGWSAPLRNVAAQPKPQSDRMAVVSWIRGI
jgi:Family of unknown function (DUF6869)